VPAELTSPRLPMTDDKLTSPAPVDASGALASALEESLRKEKARRFRKGDRVSGRVYKLSESMAFIDLGGRSEGMIDLTEHRRPDGTLDFEEGTQLEGIVIDVAANGVLLRRALISQEESVAQLAAAQAAGIPVQAKVTAFNKGGLELELFGLRGFCPSSQVDVHKVEDLSTFVGQTHQFRISEVSPDGKKIVLSRRAMLQEDHDRKIAELRARIVPGATFKGKVVRIQPFGAFVDLGGIEGLCHVTELTRTRVHDANAAVKVGDEIDVQVLKVDDTTDKNGKKLERIALSHKGFEQDPWADVAARFPVGSKVTGKVARLQPFGAFIEVAPGIDGLVHISAIVDRRIEHPRDALKEGEEVTATVLVVEPDKKRLSLSIKEPRKAEAPAAPTESKPRRAGPGGFGAGARDAKQAQAPRAEGKPRRTESRPARAEGAHAEGAEAAPKAPPRPHYAVNQVHDAIVEKVEPFGVFVTLPGGGRALIPNNELGVNKNADQKVDYRKFFSAGATVRIAITQIDQRGQVRASKVEAERSDERAMVKEWSSTQKKSTSGGAGFGTFADLFKKANLGK
jgi:small subunit ribosomal protein S1